MCDGEHGLPKSADTPGSMLGFVLGRRVTAARLAARGTRPQCTEMTTSDLAMMGMARKVGIPVTAWTYPLSMAKKG